ncbi:MAG: glutamine--fructose-6-phosphate transaminase (isomerizing) [Patescibacteria group bacterium]|nr:MAG: glutamine--fructose-6-phosphate transaminase (isomerizing) [Patescibacteria group bacterium]
MCGIAAILSKEKGNLIPKAISMLRDLEYRGYDSAGIAVMGDADISTYKCLGAPSEHLREEDIYTAMGESCKNVHAIIAHNRWSTVGKPSIKNAHPHTDCGKHIAIVHNGTILNYAPLKKDLVGKGHTFRSDTDSEVIAHQIEEFQKNNISLEEAILHAVELLEGSFGLVVFFIDEPKKLYLVKNGSPVNIGLAPDSFIVASSVNAILRYTDKFITMRDGEFAVLDVAGSEKEYKIFHYADKHKKHISKTENTISGVSIDDLSKGEYETFMLKEIFEQPATTKSTILGRYDKKTGNAVLGGLIDDKEFLKNIKHMYTVACGTAHNAGCLGRGLIEHFARVDVQNEIASEFRYRKQVLDPNITAVFMVSQSGETADTLGAVQSARDKGYFTFGIVNVVGSAIANETKAGVYTRAGAEIGVASTKAFTSQAAIFYLLALSLARGRSMQVGDGKKFIEHLEEIPDKMKKMLAAGETIKEIVSRHTDIRNINFLARGIHIPIANEAALKFKELTYMEAGSYPLGELKHGPIAIVDKECLSVIIMPKDPLFDLSKNSIEQIKSKGGRVLVITDESGASDPLIQKVGDVITIPTLEDPLFYPLVEIIPLQLFAYHFARALGRDVDKPRNLAKSVTVE